MGLISKLAKQSTARPSHASTTSTAPAVARSRAPDPPRQPTAPPTPSALPPPIACPICDCPVIWSSIYEPDAYRCCECEPAPAASLIANRWLIVDWGCGPEWEDFRPGTSGERLPDADLQAATRDAALADGRDGPNPRDAVWDPYSPRLRVGTLIAHQVPAAVRCNDGSTMTVFESGWNTLVRLIARNGFTEAWWILGAAT